MVGVRIRSLRAQRGLSQEELARHLSITRSSVNAWEMGISVPSTQYVIELAKFFNVSSDYLLGIDATAALSVAGLTDADVQLVYHLVEHLRDRTGQQ